MIPTDFAPQLHLVPLKFLDSGEFNGKQSLENPVCRSTGIDMGKPDHVTVEDPLHDLDETCVAESGSIEELQHNTEIRVADKQFGELEKPDDDELPGMANCRMTLTYGICERDESDCRPTKDDIADIPPSIDVTVIQTFEESEKGIKGFLYPIILCGPRRKDSDIRMNLPYH